MNSVLVKCHKSDSNRNNNNGSLALGYLSSSLKKNGYDVTIIDNSLRNWSFERLVEFLLENFSLIGFSISDNHIVESTIKTIEELRRKGSKSHITIGGNCATFNYNDILNICPHINSVILHEGEKTLCELAGALSRKKEWRKILGIAYKENEKVITNPQRQFIKNLDTIQFPERYDLEYNSYKSCSDIPVNILSSRGCYFNCTFCSVRSFYSVNGCPTWRRRSVENVIKEIKILTQRYSVDNLLFVDDLFLDSPVKSKAYVEEFVGSVKDNRLRFIFTISASIQGIDRNLLQLLKEVGLRQVFIGAESANQGILNYFNKETTPKTIANAIETLLRLDIDPAVSFINFTPITNINHLRENISFFKSFGINIFHGILNRYQVFSGTPLYEKLKKEKKIKGQFPNLDYTGIDEKAELVYSICTDTLGPFVLINKEISRLGRKVRRIELDYNTADLRREIKKRYNKLVKIFTNEAISIFEEIISFVEKNSSKLTPYELQKFKCEIAKEAKTAYFGWSNMLDFFERFMWKKY